MIDHSRPHLTDPDTPPATLPDFTPVPRAKIRYDGWTPDRQRRFIEALADLGSIKAAAHRVNMTPEGAYLLRRHPQAGEFRAAWEAALALGVQRLEDVAMERALHGVEVPIYHFGEVVGSRVVYNDRLLMFLLRNRAPRRFAADSLANLSASDSAQLERLKRQWREEWEDELTRQDEKDEAELIASINAKLDRMRERAEARQAQDAAEQEDEQETHAENPHPQPPQALEAPEKPEAQAADPQAPTPHIRLIDNLLTQGDKPLGLPRPHPKTRARGLIGTSNLAPITPPAPEQHALEEWQAHVEAGRIGTATREAQEKKRE